MTKISFNGEELSHHMACALQNMIVVAQEKFAANGTLIAGSELAPLLKRDLCEQFKQQAEECGALLRKWDEEEPDERPYTVLLLLPDHMRDGGHESDWINRVHVHGTTVEDAMGRAQDVVCENHHTQTGDLGVMAIFEGHLFDQFVA